MLAQADQILDETHLMGTSAIQSPFLPGTKIQYAWDSTSLGLLKTCPRLYEYVIIDGWTPRDESVHLRFGIEYHQALQEYDIARANGTKHEDSVHDVVRALLERTFDWDVDLDSKAGKYKNRNSLLQLVVDYLDHFNSAGTSDPASTYILENGSPAAELSFRFALDWGPSASAKDSALEGLNPPQPYLLSGHLDRVVEFNNQLLVMDRKTTTNTPGPYYFRQFEPNNQMTLYTLAGQVVLGSPIKGVIIDAAQVLLETPNKFVRGFTYRTEGQLKEWLHDLEYWFAQAESYATAGYWPMNDTACDKFGGCRFRDICSKDPSVRERFLKADFIQQPPEERWNPLKSRER